MVPPAPVSLLIIDNRDREAADDVAPCGTAKGPVQVLRISLTTYSSYSRNARTAKLRGHIARLVDYGATRN